MVTRTKARRNVYVSIEAGHPVPDESGETAAREIALQVKALGPDDLLLALVSGGGSSRRPCRWNGISMADLKATTRELLACGAPIQDMNVVRKHLSLIQGGQAGGDVQGTHRLAGDFGRHRRRTHPYRQRSDGARPEYLPGRSGHPRRVFECRGAVRGGCPPSQAGAAGRIDETPSPVRRFSPMRARR
jgi:hypothetical protein